MPSPFILVPPNLACNQLRIDSPVFAIRDRYEEDKKWFRDNPKRRMFFRADIKEFDPSSIPISEKLQMPRLHVLVTEIAPSIHSVQPVYRGKKFWAHSLDCDSAVATVLVEMQEQKGYNALEFDAFLERIRTKNQNFAELNGQSNGSVN